MIDHEKLSNWYNFQARFYHLWRDDYRSPLINVVAGMLATDEAPLHVLDAGCGTGFLSVGLASIRPGWRVEGLDAAEGMLAVAREQAARRGLANVSFRAGDARRLPLEDASLDGIVTAGLFPNLDAPGPALGEFHRIVRAGGRLVVVEVDRDSLSWGARSMFRVMILGYRVFSAIVPRFRFADRWDLRASTVDPEALTAAAREAGFRPGPRRRHGAHLILSFEKEPRA